MPHPLKKVRSYSDLMERWSRSAEGVKGIERRLLGKVRTKRASYPFWMATTPSGSRKRQICLTGGIHGDEPSGVEAILGAMRLLKANPLLMSRFHLTIFPCVNPIGYEYDIRGNGSGQDLNRQFNLRRPLSEVRFIREALKGRRFDLALEFHEDVDTPGFYLYELWKDKKVRMGETIVREVAKKYPVNRADMIDGFPADRGMIRLMASDPRFMKRMARRRQWPMAIYLFMNGTSHCITSETPLHLKMSDRVDIHLSVLKTALKRLSFCTTRP
ncbi:MAG: M14 family metallocarboxypeptidase [Nitrospiria bacterium]